MKDGDNTAELERDRKRLSGLNTRKNGVCDSPNHFERFGGGINKTSRLDYSRSQKVTDCRETQDVLQRDNLESSCSIVNCVGGGGTDLPTPMAISDVNDAFTILQNNSGEFITNIIEASRNISTTSVGDAYACMLTTRMIPVLYDMDGFTKKFNYAGIKDTLSSEIGAANNVRFFVSEQGSVTQNASLAGNDVANCFIVAKEAYKVVKMSDHYKFLLIDLEAAA